MTAIGPIYVENTRGRRYNGRINPRKPTIRRRYASRLVGINSPEGGSRDARKAARKRGIAGARRVRERESWGRGRGAKHERASAVSSARGPKLRLVLISIDYRKERPSCSRMRFSISPSRCMCVCNDLRERGGERREHGASYACIRSSRIFARGNFSTASTD